MNTVSVRPLLRVCRDLLTHRNQVSVAWGPLASAFDSIKLAESRPKPSNDSVGLFEIPELRSSDGFRVFTEKCVNNVDKLIKEATDPNRERLMVKVFDDLSDSLCQVADLSEFIRIAHPAIAYSEAAETASTTVSGLVEKLNTNSELYEALRRVVSNGDKFPTTDEDEHVANLFLTDFQQSGIHLSQNARNRVVALNETILQLGQMFSSMASRSQAVDKNSLPEDLQSLFTTKGNHLQLSNLYVNSSKQSVREIAYKAFLKYNEQQESVLLQLLHARYLLAQHCGFPTYAHRSLKGSTAGSPETVMEFLNLLSDGLSNRANHDFDVMSVMKREESGGANFALAVWDTAYFTHKAKKLLFSVDASEYAAYFSLGTCMEGLDNLLYRLYGLRLVPVEMRPGECWASGVCKLAVTDDARQPKEEVLGHIYCDFFERKGKPNQDCHFTIRGGRALADGSYQRPVVVVMLNLSPPTCPTAPTLLLPNMVDNLFHEMGHAMHSMLARTRYQHVTGTRCCTDLAEVPSILMEYFANDVRVLATFARHFQTRDPMPADMLQRLSASKKLFVASETQMQVFYSVLDQIYHGSFPLRGTLTEILADVHSRYYGLPYVPNTAWHLKFTHLIGYGAKYYSYLVSRALASWIWTSYFEDDPFDRVQGERYRDECLSHGGGKPPQKLIADFLQREPSPKTLADALLNEIDDKDHGTQIR